MTYPQSLQRKICDNQFSSVLTRVQMICFLSFPLFLAGNKSCSIISENHNLSALCCACSLFYTFLVVCSMFNYQ